MIRWSCFSSRVELLLDVTAEPIRHLAVTTGDHNFHVNLPLTAIARSGTCSTARPDADDGGVRPADLVFDPTIAC